MKTPRLSSGVLGFSFQLPRVISLLIFVLLLLRAGSRAVSTTCVARSLAGKWA